MNLLGNSNLNEAVPAALLRMGMRMTGQDKADLLHGVKAIAEFLNLKPKRVYYLIDKHGLRVFKIGGRVCARKASLTEWINNKDQQGQVDD